MHFLIYILCFIVGMTVSLAIFKHERAVFTYLKNIAIGLDQLANAILGGDPDETISSVAGKARNDGLIWGCWLCKILDAIDTRHCDGAIEPGEGRRAVWKMNKEPKGSEDV